MERTTFKEWFLSVGIKNYGLSFLGMILFDTLLILNYDGIWTDGGYGATTEHVIMVGLGHVALLGFNIATIWHMLGKFKKRKK